MKRLIIVLSLVACLTAAGFEERVIVKFKSGGVDLFKIFDHSDYKHLFGNLYVIKADESEISRLRLMDEVEYIQVDQRSIKQPFPSSEIILDRPLGSDESVTGGYFNDPRVDRSWFFSDDAEFGISVHKTYEELGPSKGKPIIVAVVDTGVYYKHRDLEAVMWTNEKEIPANGIDDDKNGYIDDIHGINTYVRDEKGKATVNVLDTHDHGTHVAGIIGASHNNYSGSAGVASNVKIMALRTVPNNADESDVDIIEAFLYAAKHGAKIINCSFGKRENEGGMAVNDTIDHIGKQYGVLVVAAAGNDNGNIDSNPMYPASFKTDYLLVVASTTSLGTYSTFSNYGKVSVDLAAPGSGIYSTLKGGTYGEMSGTSMASPVAAGVAAEVLSRGPTLSPLALKKRLMDTSVGISRRVVKSSVTNGRIDLYNAITNREGN